MKDEDGQSQIAGGKGQYKKLCKSGLPRFWNDAFHAAYDHLVSDVRSVRDAAVSEIAKMSLHSLPLHHLKSHSIIVVFSDQIVQNIMGSRKMKQAESSMDTTIDNNQ
ncbi:hypothetical protein JHK86_048667 [Glycine max]|nr:hypothetical protein JHK86_048667 [Glycine max]